MDQLSQETITELKTLFDDLSKATIARPDDNVQNAGDSEDKLSVQFTKLQSRLDEILSNVQEDSDVFYKVIAMKQSLTYEEAKIHLNRSETDAAQDLLEKTLEQLSEKKEHPQLAFLYIRIVNHLAYLLSKKGEMEKARSLLEEVTENKPTDIIVYSTEELFYNKRSDETQSTNKFGKLMANNLQMLGWVYGKIGDHEMYTLKLHEALQQLLNIYDNDLVQWACRCIRLALLFLNKCHYVAARYHLSAAGTVLDSLEATMTLHPELGKAQADLARCWIHYSLHLFGTSKKIILERMCTEAGAKNDVEEEIPEASVETIDVGLLFTELDVVVDAVPALTIKTTEQARELFNYAQLWLKRVRVYYTIRDYPILYVNAVLNQSELYRYLAFYEPDLDSQYRVQKLRADSLEQLSSILKEVRPKCYVAVSVELLRELAEVQIELMSLNLRKLYSDGPQNSEYEIRRRIQAVSDIHTKLEGVGDMLGHSSLEDQEMLEESDNGLNCNEDEVVEEEAEESVTESDVANIENDA